MASTYLLIHNIGYVFSSILIFSIAAFIYVKDHKPVANRMMILGFLAVGVFTASHVIGVNIADPHLSKMVLMWNTSGLFISCFMAHSIIAFLGKEKEQRLMLIAIYAVTIILFFVYILFPDTFLLDSAPKLYFPNYYVAGSLQWLIRLFANGLIPGYFLYQMLGSYRTADSVMKNRLKYLFSGIFLGYGFGFTAVPLIYNIPVDPVWSIFFVIAFAVPFAYGVLKYDLMDIRIIAKQAFVYSVLVATVGIFVTLFNFSNNSILASVPGFPAWVFPLASSVLAVSTGFLVWRRIRETDVLKYEFMTVITHKFRTPLTRIKWSAENLSKAELPTEEKQSVLQIQNAADNLVGLTNLLVTLSESDDLNLRYSLKPQKIKKIIEDIVAGFKGRIYGKKVDFVLDDEAEDASVYADETGVRSVLQILLDNAAHYCPAGGPVIITIISQGGRSIVVRVADTGVGISKDELPRIFNKFFRGTEAKKIDTEGMGIGLFMARRTIEKQGGKLWAESAGENKGSTFFIRLPAAIS